MCPLHHPKLQFFPIFFFRGFAHDNTFLLWKSSINSCRSNVTAFDPSLSICYLISDGFLAFDFLVLLETQDWCVLWPDLFVHNFANTSARSKLLNFRLTLHYQTWFSNIWDLPPDLLTDPLFVLILIYYCQP